MRRSMADMQSVTAEIRRGKKIEEEETTGQNIMSASATQVSHNNGCLSLCTTVVTLLSLCVHTPLSTSESWFTFNHMDK